MLDKGTATVAKRMVPYAVFIDPQLGRVGLTERQAREEGRNYRVAKMPMTHVARSLEQDETRGFMKVLVDADTDLILGASILSSEGAEIMSMIQIAMMGQLPYTILRDAIFNEKVLPVSVTASWPKSYLGYTASVEPSGWISWR